MARKNTLEIEVKATDKASPVLRGVGQAMGGLGTAARYAMTGIGVAAAGALAGVTALGAGLTKLAIDAAPLEGIQAAFEGITGGGERMLAQLREQSAHMITDRELMKSYNLAAQLVGRQFADKLPTAMRYLTKVAAATGQSMGYMMDSLVRGVGRASPLILDNLGVQVDLTRAYEKQAKALGKNVDQLTKAEQQAAIMNEVMEQLARNTEKMPDVMGSASAGLASLSTALANAKDEIGTAFMPALKAVLTLFDELRPMFQQAVTWVADLVRGWAGGFADLIARAATWGANIVESLASGISGSNAIVRALRNVANTITSWLAPGSPPKLLPDLPDWGAGALDAWLSGWTGDTLLWSQLAQNLRGNLRPFLEGIDLGKGIDEGALRDVFQADAPTMRRYLRAYEGVGRAVAELKDAREELAEAEESGDEEAIEAARGRVKVAERAEYSARRAFNAEERRLEQRISAEAQIARAVTETAQVQAKAAADSAAMAEEAKRRAIEQAHLQYRLAVAGTPLAQIPIWEEELAKAEEGSAEYWQIMTRLVELRRAAAKGAGESLGAAVGDGFNEGLEEKAGKPGGGLVEKIDWKGIGEAIASELWGAFTDWVNRELRAQLTAITNQFDAWANDPELLARFEGYGETFMRLLLDAAESILGAPAKQQEMGDALVNYFYNAIRSVDNLLGSLFQALMEGMIGEATDWLWEKLGREGAPEGGLLGELDRWWQGQMKPGEMAPALPNLGAVPEPPVYGPALPPGYYPQPAPGFYPQAAPGGDTNYNNNITINAPGGNPREVEKAVIGGLRAAGIPVAP